MGELVATDKQINFITALERVAINPDVDVLKMEKIMDLQERVLDKQSELEYNKAMSACQADMPTIAKDKVNQHTKSKYAQFETIIIHCKPVYTKHGFAVSFGTADAAIENHVRITASVMHSGGHCKEKYVDLPLDISGIGGKTNKTAMHAVGSTFSYGKRYLFGLIFNIAIADEDQDGNLPNDITVQSLIDNMEVVRGAFSSIHAIKEAFYNKEWMVAAEAWHEVTAEERDVIWRAPSKGGVFTTEEIKAFKCNEYVAVRNEFYKSLQADNED